MVDAARDAGIPVIFFQEVHRRSLVDFGRELDGVETVHGLDGDEATELDDRLLPQEGDDLIVKRRYSCFFGTELEILLKGLGVTTLILIGGLTDVCVHYTFVDGHQHDYFVRVVEDCVLGSSQSRRTTPRSPRWSTCRPGRGARPSRSSRRSPRSARREITPVEVTA